MEPKQSAAVILNYKANLHFEAQEKEPDYVHSKEKQTEHHKIYALNKIRKLLTGFRQMTHNRLTLTVELQASGSSPLR
jgi:hypothetical protein